MSVQNIPDERICYVHCNFCNTILAVSVPWSSWTAMVTVRCGHCSNLLSVNVGALLHHLPLLDFQMQKQAYKDIEEGKKECDSSSSCIKIGALDSEEPNDQPIHQIPPIRPPEKRQRVPSAYNNFIKEEIQRIKACNPKISHREAFSTAAKNWAHFPHMDCELKLEESKQS